MTRALHAAMLLAVLSVPVWGYFDWDHAGSGGEIRPLVSRPLTIQAGPVGLSAELGRESLWQGYFIPRQDASLSVSTQDGAQSGGGFAESRLAAPNSATVAATLSEHADGMEDSPAVQSLVRGGESDRSSSRTMTVRLTWYLPTGDKTFTGVWPFPGGVAVDPRVIPLGTRLRIAGEDRVWIANDTGGLVKGAQIDVYVESRAEGQALLARLGERVEIELVP